MRAISNNDMFNTTYIRKNLFRAGNGYDAPTAGAIADIAARGSEAVARALDMDVYEPDRLAAFQALEPSTQMVIAALLHENGQQAQAMAGLIIEASEAAMDMEERMEA